MKSEVVNSSKSGDFAQQERMNFGNIIIMKSEVVNSSKSGDFAQQVLNLHS